MDNKKTLIAALILGGVAGHHIDDIIEKYNFEADRYPVIVEYNIMENCISSHNEPLPYRLYVNKKEICACALQKTELEHSYISYQDDKDLFLSIFEKNANQCMK